MPTRKPDPKARSGRRTRTAHEDDAVFHGDDNIIPGEVLLTLVADAADSMTASVPLHPFGPARGFVGTLGVDDLDQVLSDLGAHDITRLGTPDTGTSDAVFLAAGIDPVDHTLGRSFRVGLGPDQDVEEAVARLSAVDSVEVAEPNRYRETSVIPDDPQFPQQWGLPKINAPEAWDRTTGSAGITVAVIDSGVQLTHPELAPLLVPGYDMVDLGPNPVPPPGFRFEGDFAGRDAIPEDEVGHGTHVAGTIAAVSNNAVGVAGVTWQCRIMPVKALTRLVRISDGQVRGTGSSADVAAAVRWAADHGAHVINMSLGSSGTTTVESSAIAYAISMGVVVVAAMGNDGSSNPSYPAAYPGVIAVGAVDATDKRASFSQTGAHINVVAPGVSVLSTHLGSGYATLSGTSMATPHVAGVAALIRSVKPSASVAEVTDILESTARNLKDNASDPVPNTKYGWGLVDALAAINKADPQIFLPITKIPQICQGPKTLLIKDCIPLKTRLVKDCIQPKTVLVKDCPLPKTLIPKDCVPVKTLLIKDCLQFKTVLVKECLIPKTVDASCVVTQPPTTTVLPTTILRPGLQAEESYDPYGYLAAQTEEAVTDAYTQGYADGFTAAAQLWAEALGQQADDPGGADPYGQNPFQG